jgi:ribokinase
MIAVIGGYGQGLSMRVPRSPEAGETVAGGVLHVDHGGKGSNQAVAVRRLGTDARIITALGDDDAAAAARRLWAAEGVEDRAVEIAGQATMAGFIIVDSSGENRICVADGALAALRPEHIDQPMADIGAEDVVLVSMEIPVGAAERALQIGREHGALTILNPAPMSPAVLPLLRFADITTPNRRELAAMADRALPSTPEEVAACCAEVRDQTLFTGAVLATLGTDGAYLDDDGSTSVEPVLVDDVADTTGAGDAYSAALAVALHEGASLHQAARFAAAAGALTVTRDGVLPSLPDRAAIDQLTSSGVRADERTCQR